MRSAAMVQASPATTTDDPDLRLDVDGRRVSVAGIENGAHRFVVGPGAAMVRLRSRSAPPGGDRAGGDQRRLGVALGGIALRGRNFEVFLPHDDPSLVEGFHAAEAGHRWTDGDAMLPAMWLRGLREGFTLDVEVLPSGLRYPVGD